MSIDEKREISESDQYYYPTVMVFDGVDDYIDFGDNIDVGTTGVYTFETRLKTTSSVPMSGIRKRGVKGYSFDVVSGEMSWYLDDDVQAIMDTADTATVNDGEWHILKWVVDKDNDTITRYIDGIVSGTIDSISTIGEILTTDDLTFSSTEDPFEGVIDYIEIETSNKTYRYNFSESAGKKVYDAGIESFSLNLVTNGDFSDGTNNWFFGEAGVDFSIINGKGQIAYNNTTNYGNINQIVATVLGRKYELTMDVEQLSSAAGNNRVTIGSNAYGNSPIRKTLV